MKCEEKMAYSKNEAERIKREIGKNMGKDERVYQCPKCHHYHLTKHTNKY